MRRCGGALAPCLRARQITALLSLAAAMAALSLLPAFASKYGLGSSYTRSGPAGEPAAAEEDEETQCVVSPVTLLLGDGSEAGAGSLYVTTR